MYTLMRASLVDPVDHVIKITRVRLWQLARGASWVGERAINVVRVLHIIKTK